MRIFKKYFVIGIIITLIGASFLPSVTSTNIKSNQSTKIFYNTWYVDDDADCPGDGSKESPFCRIEYAIDIASSGDKIRVYSGIYYENNLIVDESIEIIGNGSESTIIDGSGAGNNIININRDGVKVSGFEFRNCGYIGVFVKLCNGGTITNNNFYDVNVGINLDNSENIVISENRIDKFNSYGIWVYQCNNIDIEYNHINWTTHEFRYSELFQNQWGAGIFLIGSDSNEINFNKIYKCNHGIYFLSSGFNEVHNNDVKDNEIGLFVLMSFFNAITKNNFDDNNVMNLVAVFAFDRYPDNWWGNRLIGPIGRCFRILAGVVSLFPWSREEFDL